MSKILLVDDEPDILEFLKYNLEQEDFEVLTSTNGKDALKKILLKPDLIILDIMMPEMDGFELYQQIKSDKNFRYIPIIFLTAKSGETNEIKGLDLGASFFSQANQQRNIKTGLGFLVAYSIPMAILAMCSDIRCWLILRKYQSGNFTDSPHKAIFIINMPLLLAWLACVCRHPQPKFAMCGFNPLHLTQ